MCAYEPHVAEQVFHSMLQELRIPIFFGERLERKKGVITKDAKIQRIQMESGLEFQGLMFIDAGYEGDLMAASGVSYTYGRESNSQYGEHYNGFFPNIRTYGKIHKIDPYRVKGDPASGLLFRIRPCNDQRIGEGDREIQAYNYRMCLTDVRENRVQIEKPESYQEQDYELLFRAIEAEIPMETFFKLDLMPNRKTDSNNNGLVSTDFVGMNWEYPEADYETREKIAKAHENWQKGLIWTLQNHSRVPKEIRNYYAPWGLAKDEFIDNGHWPHQLYIRECKRMISAYVVTDRNLVGKRQITDGVGVGSYFLDSHATQYILAPEGYLAAEGGLYRKIPGPFPISFRAIIPKRYQCQNLLVPVCVSATHAAYGSIRMEPVLMILGQSAATAACLAIDHHLPLQDLPYELLRERLIADGQVLEIKKKY